MTRSRPFGLATLLKDDEACARNPVSDLADHDCRGEDCFVCDAVAAFARASARIVFDVVFREARCELRRVRRRVKASCSAIGVFSPVKEGTCLVI